MDRRGFLRTLIGGVAAGAAVRSWPFRVFSFPSEVIAPSGTAISYSQLAALDRLSVIYYNEKAIENLKKNLVFDAIMAPPEYPLKFRSFQYELS